MKTFDYKAIIEYLNFELAKDIHFSSNSRIDRTHQKVQEHAQRVCDVFGYQLTYEKIGGDCQTCRVMAQCDKQKVCPYNDFESWEPMYEKSDFK